MLVLSSPQGLSELKTVWLTLQGFFASFQVVCWTQHTISYVLLCQVKPETKDYQETIDRDYRHYKDIYSLVLNLIIHLKRNISVLKLTRDLIF